jgi:hypothetical protein
MADEQKERIRFVCEGRRYDCGQKELYIVLREVESGKTRHFWVPKKRGHALHLVQPGALYSFEAVDGSSIYPGTVKYEGKWANDADSAAWQAATRAAEIDAAAEKLHKKEAAGHLELMKLLRPLRKEWTKAVGYRRAALELAVLDVLRRPVYGDKD